MNIIRLASIGVISLVAGVAQAVTLEGSTVSAALYCCTAPTEPYRVSTVETATVGPTVEFPINTFEFLSGGTWDEGQLDIGESTIQLNLFTAGVTNSGSFNGFVFTFVNAPVITGATVRADSTFVPTDVSHTPSSILINVLSIPYFAGSYFVVDVALAPIPEPPIYLLLLAGLFTYALAASRQQPN